MTNGAYLAHHGIKGQKWGQRKYQNADGSLTALGRVRYGVGAAKNAIRKKFKPTNVELNAQIRKQKSKNLNKQKRRQLRDLKKGIDPDASSSSSNNAKGQHKRFSEMSDEDIAKRIKRLESEVKLAELEATKSWGPGKRYVMGILAAGGKKGLENAISNAIGESGAKIIKEALNSKSNEGAKKNYEDELAAKKAKEDLEKWNNEHPEGLAKYSKKSKEALAKKAKEEAWERAEKERENYRKAAEYRKTVANAETAEYKANQERIKSEREQEKWLNEHTTSEEFLTKPVQDTPKKKKKKKKSDGQAQVAHSALIVRKTWN